jgi:hypothetical protein
MAIALGAELAAAQDEQSRKPIVEIVSSPSRSDIPFDGQFLTAETFQEYDPSVISHSSGRMVIAYVYYQGTTSGIKLVRTDAERTEFFTTTLPLYTYIQNEIKSVSICEMTNGHIGMVLLVHNKTSSRYYLVRRIYTVEGAAVSDADIAYWTSSTYTSKAWVQTIGENAYLLVYGKASGSDFYIYKRTSADYLTWSNESALSIGGLTSTWRLSNPSLIKISTGDIWLWFDALEQVGANNEELTNIYYSVSTDNGDTWADAVRVTDYNTFAQRANRPVAVQKTAAQMQLLFNRIAGAMHMDTNTAGWSGNSVAVLLLHFDSVARKLYFVAGTRQNICVDRIIKIDIDSWTVEQYWDTTTTPAISPAISYPDRDWTPYLNNAYCDENLIALFGESVDYKGAIFLLDGNTNTITTYAFCNFAKYGITQNVSHDIPAEGAIRHVQVDKKNNRLYVYWSAVGTLYTRVGLGYIDLKEPGPMYGFNKVLHNYDVGIKHSDNMGLSSAADHFSHVYPDDDYFIISWSNYSSYLGGTLVFILSTGALYKFYRRSTHDNYPRHGLYSCIYHANRLWGSFIYESGYGEDTKRGLCEIDFETDNIRYHRPTYQTWDSYRLGATGNNSAMIAISPHEILIATNVSGVVKFDTISETWVEYSNRTIPGFSKDGDDRGYVNVAYDPVEGLVMTGKRNILISWVGLTMFPIEGDLRQTQFKIGSDSGGWDFGPSAQLIQGYRDYNATGAAEPGSTTAMYVFWTNENAIKKKSIKWDKDGSQIDLTEFVIGEVATRKSIDGSPSSLSFSVSHGHLFDPYNQASLYSIMLRKGRKLALRFGEKIDGSSYWMDAGSYYVTGTSFYLERGQYPEMKVEAEDRRAIWQQHHVYATEIYNTGPKEILTDVLQKQAGLTLGDIAMPDFVNSAPIEMQWIETTMDEIINQICHRFGYYFRFNQSGKATARRIVNMGDPDHVYPDNTKLFRFTPDDRYSDFTNRVTVQGQENTFTEVTFEEERVGFLNGTVGWWGYKKTFDVWYSEDRSRRCVHPRLHVLETATSIAFQLQGKITESLREGTMVGYQDRYCIVRVEAPNLTPQLITAIALVGAGLSLGDLSFPMGGMTVPVGKVIEKAGLIWALMILASTGNYQYEIWAQPKGQVRRSIQATWDDIPHQNEINAIVEQKIDDPLCQTVSACHFVANFEGMIVQMQRRRVLIEKVAHLQDEDGDIIRVRHPYSGQTVDLFVTSLERRFKKSTGANDGYFIDQIEGWVINQ